MEKVQISTQNQQDEIIIPGDGVVMLRQRLKQLNVWPDAGDQFLALMPHSRWHSPPLTEVDNQWLPKVVEDAAKGIDIGANYPAFFQKLLASDTLRQSFLKALDIKLGLAG
jgi:hypothetical protein